LPKHSSSVSNGLINWYISSYPKFSDEPEWHHYQDLLAPETPSAEVKQDTLVVESMNIQGAGIFTSSLKTASSLSLGSVSLMTAMNPAPIVRMSEGELVKPLGPTPNVLIVEDNPINVCIN
jgi:hypothetical protein